MNRKDFTSWDLENHKEFIIRFTIYFLLHLFAKTCIPFSAKRVWHGMVGPPANLFSNSITAEIWQVFHMGCRMFHISRCSHPQQTPNTRSFLSVICTSDSLWISYKRLFQLLLLFYLPGINRTALREIKLLQELSHPNIIGVSILSSAAVHVSSFQMCIMLQLLFWSCLCVGPLVKFLLLICLKELSKTF